MTARQMMSQLELQGLSLLPPLSDSLTERTISVSLTSTYSPRLKIIHPSTHSSSPRPLIVLFYAGSFKAGSVDQLTEPGRTFAERFNAVVVLGSYRMIPEVRWPVPWQDGWNLLVYLSHHAHEQQFGKAELSADKGGGFVVGGVSAGASIAAVCAGIDGMGFAIREGVESLGAELTGVMVNVPFLVVPEIVPEEWKSKWTAWQDNEKAEGFNTGSLRAVMDGIQCTDYTSRWFSPVSDLVSQGESLDKRPRVYVSVCEMDPLRDDGKLYCDLLKRRGIETKLDLFPEDGHNGWSVMPFPRKSKAPTIEEAYLEGMKWLLKK